MILPIYAIGQPVLKKVAVNIEKDYPQLPELIANMWETMYHADGVGLAAPQIGLSIRLFVIDSTLIHKEVEGEKTEGFKRVFINAQRVEETGKPFIYEEGCLSIPHIRGDVERPDTLTLQWLDENFEPHTETFTGLNARVVQHEYDHLEGILFTEKLKPLKKRMIQRRLDAIKKGAISTDYKMRFFNVR